MLSRRLLARNIAHRLMAGEDSHAVMRSLSAYIVEHRQDKDIERILTDIRLELARHGNVSALVMTARPLDDELRRTLVAYVADMTASKNVSLIEHVDPQIVGGVIIETPDKRIDASVASKLKHLRNVA